MSSMELMLKLKMRRPFRFKLSSLGLRLLLGSLL